MSDDHTLRVYDSITGLLPNEDNPTPLVRLNCVVPYRAAAAFAKLEWYNPFGAVKDRIAANLVGDAERRSLLGEGGKLVEPTSGNTGLGLAMVANTKGYSLRTPLSSAIPLEKRTALRFFGADLIELEDSLCPAPGAPEGAIAMAMQIAESEPDHYMPNQYANDANPEAHYRTTGPEIWRQTGGKVTHLVAALGTCGTITGAGRYLRERNADIRLIGVHPEVGHDIPGVRSIRQLEQTRFFQPEEYDHVVEVTNREAYDMCLRLNREEGIIAGPSSGMAVAGLLKLVEDRPDAVIVMVFPDNIFKYPSSMRRHFPDLYADARESDQRDAMMDRLVALARNSYNTVEVDEASALRQRGGARFIDVREPEQYRSAHVAGAVNIPLDDLEAGGEALPGDRDAPVVTVCDRGNISLRGMLILKSLGYTRVRSMNGGTTAWIERGHPVESE